MLLFFFFFFNDTATTEIYTLSLHDALPIYGDLVNHGRECSVSNGQIAIQAEGAEVEFRKMDLSPLAAK